MTEAAPEQSLWRAVLSRMLEDAALPQSTPDNKRWRQEARNYLRRGNRDFHTVCDLADVPPGAVLAAVPA